MTAEIHKLRIFEDSDVSLMARIKGTDGDNIQQADVSAIAYTVIDEDSTSPTAASASLTVANVVYDTLQTDSRWTKDSTGYNFRWDAPASLFATGAKKYRVEIKFTGASSEVYHLVFSIDIISLYGS